MFLDTKKKMLGHSSHPATPRQTLSLDMIVDQF